MTLLGAPVVLHVAPYREGDASGSNDPSVHLKLLFNLSIVHDPLSAKIQVGGWVDTRPESCVKHYFDLARAMSVMADPRYIFTS